MEQILINWFKELFEVRTKFKTILDFDPTTRVTWTEIFIKMKELGFSESVVDARFEFDKIFKKHLKRWCNKILKEHGERSLPKNYW